MIVEVSEGDEVVTVSWKRPDFPNGILTSYTVSLELYGNEGAVIESKEVDNVTLSTTINITGLSELVYHSGQPGLLLWCVCGTCFIDHSFHRRWCSLSRGGGGC